MSIADELLKYKSLLDDGVITQEEFEQAKAKLLGEESDNLPFQKEKINFEPASQPQTSTQPSVTRQSRTSTSSMNSRPSFTNTTAPTQEVFQQRKGFKGLSTVMFVFAVIYIIMGNSMKNPALTGMCLFCGILGVMFMVLSKIPKECIRLKGDKGMKKSSFVILCVIIAFVCVGVVAGTGAPSKNDEKENSQNVSDKSDAKDKDAKDKDSEKKDLKDKETEEEKPTIKLANDYEKKLYKAVADHDGEVTSITLEKASDANNQTDTEWVEFKCKNSESVVTTILNALVATQTTDNKVALYVNISDSAGKVPTYMTIVAIDPDGNMETRYEHPQFKSERNIWIQGLFSAWDGSCNVLEKAIKKRLNDEKSYDHIETNYERLNKQDRVDELNEIMKKAGLGEDVFQVGDVMIITTFSAKNGFGGVIKSNAYGRARYETNTVTLLTIE